MFTAIIISILIALSLSEIYVAVFRTDLLEDGAIPFKTAKIFTVLGWVIMTLAMIIY